MKHFIRFVMPGSIVLSGCGLAQTYPLTDLGVPGEVASNVTNTFYRVKTDYLVH